MTSVILQRDLKSNTMTVTKQQFSQYNCREGEFKVDRNYVKRLYIYIYIYILLEKTELCHEQDEAEDLLITMVPLFFLLLEHMLYQN